jgi:hypothetical protein
MPEAELKAGYRKAAAIQRLFSMLMALMSQTLMRCVLGFGPLQVQRNAFAVDEHHAAVD